MRNILYQQAQRKERETTTRPRTGAHSPAGVPGIPDRGAARLLPWPASTILRNWSASSSLRMDAAMSQDGCEEGCHYCNGPETD